MADEKMQNENKKSLNTREDNVAEDIRREAAGKDAEMAADKTTEKEGAPKKKNLAFVVRPQNSKNSSRLQGKRPGQGRQGQNQGRPNGDGKRPAAGQSRSNGEGKPARTEKPAAKSERPVRAAEDRPARPAQNGARSERPQGSRTGRSWSTSRNNPDHFSVFTKAPHLLRRGFLMGGSEPADRKRTLPSTFIIPSPASHPESAQIQRRISNNDRIHAVTVPFPQTLQIMFVGHISR